MIGIDTNLLLRYLAENPEEEAQTQKAITLIDTALQMQEPVFINNIVLCETVWVLHYRYKVPKSALAKLLEALFTQPGFLFEDRTCLIGALDRYRKASVGFADCLIDAINRKHHCKKTYSFDKQAIKSLKFTAL